MMTKKEASSLYKIVNSEEWDNFVEYLEQQINNQKDALSDKRYTVDMKDVSFIQGVIQAHRQIIYLQKSVKDTLESV